MKTPEVFVVTPECLGSWESFCGCNLAAVVVPVELKDRFFASEAYDALLPTVVRGAFVFVGPGRVIEVKPVAYQVTLEAADARAVYLRFDRSSHGPPQQVRRTVEVVPGRVFADLGEGVDVLGVEVLL